MGAVQSALRIDRKVIEFPEATQPEKAIVTLKAQLALAGHKVYDCDNRDFLVSKYGMSRYCQDFADLQGFAKKLGVTP